MYNNQKFYTVTEVNVTASDNIATQVYAFTDQAAAQSKLYRLWGYGANPDAGETRQFLSAYMMEHDHDRGILLESKVFDYREPEPAPEPELYWPHRRYL